MIDLSQNERDLLTKTTALWEPPPLVIDNRVETARLECGHEAYSDFAS